MKKTFYYTLSEGAEIIQVYLIDGNIPRRICMFSISNYSDVTLKVKTYLIENNLYYEGSRIERL